ncbi:RICIN domain-containing protein [Micromonospora sp. NPDC049230]|uniref:RICIN domain-containing protein n=1 Tax=Micromonospora sp. NPDC049230 TaxID=3155502 RepID=UPI0033F93A42
MRLPKRLLHTITTLAVTAVAAVTAIVTMTPAAHAAIGDGSTSDANISFVGRWDRSSTGVFGSNWAGAYLRTGFTGTTVRLKQRNSVEFWASIDGGPFVNYRNVSGTVNLTPTPLRAGNHTLVVSYRQRAGSYNGDAVFIGLVLDANAHTFALPVAPKLVEFIGDSITAGTGSSKLALTDYGWLVGERLGTEHTQIAIGGACLVAAPDGCWGMERRYFNLDAGSSIPWDFSRYRADAVVINLGTNDVGHSVSGATFQTSYTAFIRNIRAKYPNAAIIALKTFRDRYVTETRAAVQTVNNSGDANVYFVDTTGWLTPDGLTDAVHPNDLGHQMIADRLTPIVAARLGTTTGYRVVNRATGKVLAISGNSTADNAPAVQVTDTGAAGQRWQVVDAGGGFNKLVNVASGKVLDVSGRSISDGAAVIQYRDNGGTNQHWQFVTVDGYVKLVNRYSGKVLDVPGGSTAEGVALAQWTDNGGTNQRWQLVPA